MYDIQHCFICRPSDSTLSEDAGIEPRTVAIATMALAVRRSNHSADLILSIPYSGTIFCSSFQELDTISTGLYDEATKL
jgi:hypothetical protein